MDAAQLQGLAGVDTQQPAMRDGRANHPHVQLVRKIDVGDEASPAPHERRIFKSQQTFADDLGRDLRHAMALMRA